MKKNLEYYQHYTNSHNHPKFKMLRLKYGWEGEGKFWALNNIISSSDNCKLDLKKGYNRSMVSFDLNFKPEEFEEYLQYLHKECKLIRYRSGVISTETTQENYKKVHGDRVAARERKKKFSRTNTELLKSSAEQSESSAEQNKKLNKSKTNQIKQKQSKLNKNKPKKIKKISRLDFTEIAEKEDQDQKHETSLNGKAETYFVKFWDFYNRREGDLNKIRAVFNEEVRSEDDFKSLIKATRNYNDLSSGYELKYVKMPINFLKCYRDYIKIDN